MRYSISMQRRDFLATSFLAPTLAGAQQKDSSREYYLLRRYQVQRGPQQELTDHYLREALVPGLNRLEISPVGVFSPQIGPESPSLYLLIPSTSIERLVMADFRLEHDANYVKAAAPFLNTPAKAPAYMRVDSSLMVAFEGMPKLKVPQGHPNRVFELRTYESATDQDHQRKVEMFNNGEFGVFERAGFWQVFYGDTLVGSRLPNLTYMVGFEDLAQREHHWKAFGADPEWKKLSTAPRYAFEETVSNITNVILSPTAYSQI